ncbi:hypothetical protein DSM3645_17870 [Blastopirellula marina DSM 3645]|uniref:Uncharacterized protein n=1 Tax=Blastopirellula marina DSM 3645 TaxID=314230 RepID=A3ZNZ6_9BACT|nr:hypothetical protein DSM3645_17870 [Blastopirellula marina DSM 3645]
MQREIAPNAKRAPAPRFAAGHFGQTSRAKFIFRRADTRCVWFDGNEFSPGHAKREQRAVAREGERGRAKRQGANVASRVLGGL